MKLATLLTKTTALAFILAAGATHSFASEVDCTNPSTFKGKASEEYDGSADACIGESNLVVVNNKISEKILKIYCTKKTVQMSGSKWKTKKAANFPQENCDRIGAALDCAAALKSCKTKPDEAAKETCAEKIRDHKDKKKGIDCRVDGAYDAALEALKAATGPFAG